MAMADAGAATAWLHRKRRLAVALLVLGSWASLAASSAVSEGPRCDSKPVREMCAGHSSVQKHMTAVTHPDVYAKLDRPPCGNASHSGPTIVEVQFFLQHVNEVDEKLGHITVNGYFRVWWKDPRLAFNSTADGGCFDTIDLPGDAGLVLWAPDIYYDNLVRMRTEDIGARLTQISPDGSVWRSEQTLMTIKGKFDLSQLPYDEHEIRITVASYSQSQKSMRVVPRGGVVGPGFSGVGLIAEDHMDAVWDFTGSPTAEYETPGLSETLFGYYDYVHMTFRIRRKSKFYEDQVIYPSVVFLSISYSQFYVDVTASPARATLAVMPVLIMRTMVNYVYCNLPEGSQHMWLSDFLFAVNLLVSLGCVEYAVVQFFLTVERRRAEKREGLQKVKRTAEAMIEQASEEGHTLYELLTAHAKKSKCEKRISLIGRLNSMNSEMNLGMNTWPPKVAVRRPSIPPATSPPPAPLEEEPDSPALSRLNTSLRSLPSVLRQPTEVLAMDLEVAPVEPRLNPTRSCTSSSPRRQAGSRAEVYASSCDPELGSRTLQVEMRECDMLFVYYALNVFSTYPGSKEDAMTVAEFRRALITFDIYMNVEHTARVICMILRDLGEVTPMDESRITLKFEMFTRVLIAIDNYLLDTDRSKRRNCAHYSLELQSKSPSKFTDIIARFVFPFAVLMLFVWFYAMLPFWRQ